jgi:transposase-like protein
MLSVNQGCSAAPLSYPEMIRQVKPQSKYDLRLRVVLSAKQIGVKPTARLYGTSPQTVRLWLRRYQEAGRCALGDRSHAPWRCPHKTSAELERQVVAARQRSGFGPRRLKVEFELSPSVGAIARILRQGGLVRPRKRKRVTKQDLRAVKATWAVFSKVCHDTKDLDDIPFYWPQAKALRLPVIQYTAREVRTGLTFADYAQQRSASLACVFAERVISHLVACGVDLEEVGFQSDNGSEYSGGKDQRGNPHGFKPTVESHGLSHTFIPPSAHTYNSDVETVHRLCEDEFFDRESFRDRLHFLAKAQSYWLYFNVARRNSFKQDRCPLEMLRQLTPHVNPRITIWQSAFLEDHLHILLPKEIQRLRGKHQPVHPSPSCGQCGLLHICRPHGILHEDPLQADLQGRGGEAGLVVAAWSQQGSGHCMRQR